MADYEKLTPFILKWEGGFSDHPADRGGATFCGVTLSTYRQFINAQATAEDLRKMTKDQWKKIFIHGYWWPWKASNIVSQGVANVCVDWAWASGPGTSILRVQRLLGVDADGIVGPRTLDAINSASPRELFDRIIQARLKFVEDIVQRDPSQRVFLRGWKNRINDIPYE